MLTENSKLKEVYKHPVGHDMIHKILLQTGKEPGIITNPIVGNLKLKMLPVLLPNVLDQKFLATFLQLLNSESDIPPKEDGAIKKAWWKEAVFYQIYPRSFCDSNGDGIGDLAGIVEKLDYLKELGVDAIWLSPIYDSPNDDNGYDIRDYRKIMKEFGTMEEFQTLLSEVHKREMRLIMDLVVNHTSDEHEWFQNALNDPDSMYRDYYLFRDKPNNWNSFFSGSAWNYYEQLQSYALHLFSSKQMDLNWDNPQVRDEVAEIVKFWLTMGVDGFRMDVINYISKRSDLPDGNEMIGKLVGFRGIEHYLYGPHLHEYLRELRKTAFAPHQAFSVGETPGVGMEMSKLLTGENREELDMIFSFDHLETPGHERFDEYRYDLNYYKKYMIDWMEHYGNNCWMSLFYENHDNPRIISKINPKKEYREVLGKLLAVMQFTLKGTPFIYQGQELGMVNNDFSSMDEIRDVESIHLYQELCQVTTEERAFRKVMAGTRDHARTPMQWSDSKHAGFTNGTPWITENSDYLACNVSKQAVEEESILQFYKSIIACRKEHPALIYGGIRITNKKRKDLFCYYRTDETESFYVECNLSSRNIVRKCRQDEGEILLSNYKKSSNNYLQPYEAVIRKTK